jgi:uncharacterized protein YxeA
MRKMLALLFALALAVSMSWFAFAQATTDKPADSMAKAGKKDAKAKKPKKEKKEKKSEMKKDDMSNHEMKK